MKASAAAMILLLGLAALLGCSEQSSPPPAGFTFDRGTRLLAAGSPKAAIPFLTQTVTSIPDGPEPLALLSLAYALDLQDQRAILQARLVHRPPGAHHGWEFVAVGIAKMTEHLPGEAVELLDSVAEDDPQANPVALSARQWRALALLLDGKPDQAVQALETLSRISTMNTSAKLWVTLIQAQRGRRDLAMATLVQAAKQASTDSGRAALATAGPQGTLDDADAQTLYDAAIAALAGGRATDAARSEALFLQLRQRNGDVSDTAVWLALIAGVRENWQTGRNQLKDACDTGSPESRGLASQLFSVVCALEDRPEAMIQYTLVGQRMMGRNEGAAYTHEQPQPDTVWFSDQMK